MVPVLLIGRQSFVTLDHQLSASSSASSSPWSSYSASAGKHIIISFLTPHHQQSISSSASSSAFFRGGARTTHRPANISSYPSLVSIISCQHHHQHHRRRGLALLMGQQTYHHILLLSASSAVSIIISIIVAVVPLELVNMKCGPREQNMAILLNCRGVACSSRRSSFNSFSRLQLGKGWQSYARTTRPCRALQ